MLNHDCKHSYFKLEQEILMMKDAETVLIEPDERSNDLTLAES